MNKTALIFGASRGIGRQLALSYAAAGYDLAICAKTHHDGDSRLSGSLDEVAHAVETQHKNADARQVRRPAVLTLACDVRDEEQIEHAVHQSLKQFGSVHTLVYNPGSVFWDTFQNTPLKRFDVMHQVNLRGAFVATQAVLPSMQAADTGSLIYVAPPIYSRFFRGKTVYSTSKVGLSVMAMGLAHDLRDTCLRSNTMWPATAIESEVTKQMGVPAAVMRSAHIFADACVSLSELDPKDAPQGQTLIDEDFLRSLGATDEDFVKYRCLPETEPPRMMPAKFPNLRVAEEEESVMPSPVGHTKAAAAGLTAQRGFGTSTSHSAASSGPKSRL